MPTYKANQSQPTGSSSHSNGFNIDGKVTVTANLTTADDVILMEIPAGHRLTGLKIRAGDLDTGATLAANVGFRPVHPYPSVPANPTAFLSASTSFQAAQAGWVDLAFEPMTFQEPVQIVLKPTANGTGIAGTPAIWAVATGAVIGVA